MVYNGITKTRMRLLRLLARRFSEKFSINQVARQLKLSPRGAYKMLKSMESEGILEPEKIGNSIFYHINFNSDFARKATELSLFEELKSAYARVQAKDFGMLRNRASALILYGSVLEKGENAEDIDIMAVVEQEGYAFFRNGLSELQNKKPKHIHAVVMSKEDLTKNFAKKDAVALEILEKGNILWGQDVVVNAIKDSYGAFRE
ncbi:MAG: helix-turn-helix domain-containing protein [Nanoarchaeota archaeon]|nr:helix-turn-helix domain-containing protein [Nanoarchaeota archaeon]